MGEQIHRDWVYSPPNGGMCICRIHSHTQASKVLANSDMSKSVLLNGGPRPLFTLMFYSVYSLVCCTIIALIWFAIEVFPLFGVIEYEIGGGTYLVEITSFK